VNIHKRLKLREDKGVRVLNIKKRKEKNAKKSDFKIRKRQKWLGDYNW
jgi:hypothetical protein